MAVDRRISATFKDLPGGQVLGPTFDYTHRLLDFALMAEGDGAAHGATLSPRGRGPGRAGPRSRMSPSFLNRDGLIETAPPVATPRPPT